MRKHILIAVIVCMAVLSVAAYIWYYQDAAGAGGMTEARAIGILKAAYPEFADYPSDSLPPRRIVAEQAPEGWYVAFEQMGSGRPIISVKCFLVSQSGNIAKTGEFNPEINDTRLDVSPRTCK